MNNKVKAMCAVAALFTPATAFAQDAIAVALGAAFKPVDTSTTVTTVTDDFTVVIPGQAVEGGNVVVPLPFNQSVTLPVTGGSVDEQTVTVPGVNSTVTTENTQMELVSVSVAAASGVSAVASATANNQGATAANSGATMSSASVSAKTTPTFFGNAFTSEVMVGGESIN